MRRTGSNLWTAILMAALVAGSAADAVAQRGGRRKSEVTKRGSKELRLTESAIHSEVWWNWSRSIATDGEGKVHLVYLENVSGAGPKELAQGTVYYMRSEDEGSTWPHQAALTDHRLLGHPKVAVSDDHVYVVYRTVVDGASPPASPPAEPHDIYMLLRSDDGGTTWDKPFVISDNPPGHAPAGPAGLFARGPRVHVAWSDDRDGSPEVRIRSSSNRGDDWNAARPVTAPDGHASRTPSVADWKGLVYVAWTDDRHESPACAGDDCPEELYFARSTDFGKTWEHETRLTTDPPDKLASTRAPSIDVWENPEAPAEAAAADRMLVHTSGRTRKHPPRRPRPTGCWCTSPTSTTAPGTGRSTTGDRPTAGRPGTTSRSSVRTKVT